MNKSSLLLKTLFQSTRTLNLFTDIIKTEIIYKSKYKAWVKKPSSPVQSEKKAQSLLRESTLIEVDNI